MKLLFLFLFACILIGCAGRSIEFERGVTQEAVQKELGKPRGFHRRWMSKGEIREIWVYHEKGSVFERHLYPDTRFVVFSNGKVIAENPEDPYAPIERFEPQP